MAHKEPKPKTGGRTKGTPNKKTLILKSITEALGMDVPRQLCDLLPHLDPEKKADVLLDLMSYIYPKRKAIEHSGPDGAPLSNQSPVVVILPCKKEIPNGHKD